MLVYFDPAKIVFDAGCLERKSFDVRPAVSRPFAMVPTLPRTTPTKVKIGVTNPPSAMFDVLPVSEGSRDNRRAV